MPRSQRGVNSRKSRNSGIVSGVTGEFIQSSNLTSTGYNLPYGTAAGLKMTTGILACSGGSLARQDLGLTAIHNVIAGTSLKGAVSTVTGVALSVVPEGTVSFGSGCTQVTFVPYKLNRAGVTFTAAVSIHYIGIGT